MARISIVVVVCAMLLGFGSAAFGAGTIFDGVAVKYSGAYFVYYDGVDDTLTVQILSGGGSLSIAVLHDAWFYWGGYVDIYI